MAVTSSRSRSWAGLFKSKRRWLVPLVAAPFLLGAGLHYWFKVALEPISPGKARPIERTAAPASAPDSIAWPIRPLEGRPAAEYLLGALRTADARLKAAGGYTARLRRRERIGGKLGAEQVMEVKSRGKPFAIYLRFRTPEDGKEVVFAEGRYDDHVVAHGVGFSRRLIPRIKVSPTNPLAMSGNRHPITDAGIDKLTRKLIRYRELDLEDPLAVTRLDRTKDASGREWYRSWHSHPKNDGRRPFQSVEVLYDPATLVPRQIMSYDWPEPGETGPPKLAEKYTYDNLDLDAPLTDLDFDPANPAYGFVGP